MSAPEVESTCERCRRRLACPKCKAPVTRIPRAGVDRRAVRCIPCTGRALRNPDWLCMACLAAAFDAAAERQRREVWERQRRRRALERAA